MRSPGTPGARYVGCAYRAGVEKQIGFKNAAAGEGAVATRNVRLSGKLVAYEDFATGIPSSAPSAPSGVAYRILVIDLVSRHGVRSAPTGKPTAAQQDGALEGVGPTTDLVLKRDGAVAWIVNDDFPPATPTYQVWKYDVGAQPVMLASGHDIAPGSLRLAGSTLRWRQGATLPSTPLT